MTRQEYEQKRAECWEEFKRINLDGEVQWQPVNRYDVFCAAFDRAYALGKHDKDADTVTINKDVYGKLCKYSRYVDNWVPYFDVCPICGEYNPRGCVCANCNNDKNWNNGE